MAGGADGSDASFDLTPMIDVILLLIIFFMLSSQFATSELRPVDLPHQEGAAPPSESASAKLVIDVDRAGNYSILGECFTRRACYTNRRCSRQHWNKTQWNCGAR